MPALLNSKAVEQLHQDLDEITDLYLYLPAVKTGIKGSGEGSRRPAGSKPPLSVQVVTLLDTRAKDIAEWDDTDPRDNTILDRYGIAPRLGLWVRLTLEQIDDDPTSTNMIRLHPGDWTNVKSLCQALRLGTSWIIDQSWAPRFASAMHAVRAELEQALGIRAEFKPTCRNLFCGAILDPMDNGTWYECPMCYRKYTIAEDLKALGAAQYLRGEEVAQLLDIAWSTVRRFKSEGWVRPITYTNAGIALFDLDQVRIVRDTPIEQRVKIG